MAVIGGGKDAAEDIQKLRNEVAALREDLKEVLLHFERREQELKSFEERVLRSLETRLAAARATEREDGPLQDGRLRNATLSKQHDVRLRSTHGIMPSLDMESLDEARRVIERTTRVHGVVAYKFGLTTVLRHGLARTVAAMRQVTDLPLIYDHQKAGADVPDMAGKFAATCREAGVDGLILFPVAGPRAVSEFVGNAYKNRILPIVGGDLPLPDYNVKGGGYIADDALFRIIERCVGMNADHFVVPATQPAKVRSIASWLTRKLEAPHLFLPGIGPLGGSISDAFAEAPGCRVYAVVGRAVYAADDPGEAARKLADEALRFA